MRIAKYAALLAALLAMTTAVAAQKAAPSDQLPSLGDLVDGLQAVTDPTGLVFDKVDAITREVDKANANAQATLNSPPCAGFRGLGSAAAIAAKLAALNQGADQAKRLAQDLANAQSEAIDHEEELRNGVDSSTLPATSPERTRMENDLLSARTDAERARTKREQQLVALKKANQALIDGKACARAARALLVPNASSSGTATPPAAINGTFSYRGWNDASYAGGFAVKFVSQGLFRGTITYTSIPDSDPAFQRTTLNVALPFDMMVDTTGTTSFTGIASPAVFNWQGHLNLATYSGGGTMSFRCTDTDQRICHGKWNTTP